MKKKIIALGLSFILCTSLFTDVQSVFAEEISTSQVEETLENPTEVSEAASPIQESENEQEDSIQEELGKENNISLNNVLTGDTVETNEKVLPQNTGAVSISTPAISYLDKEGNGCFIEITLTSFELSENETGVRFAIWSEKDGQDDLEWVDAKNTEDGAFTTTLDASKHDDATGIYNIHAYSVQGNALSRGILASTYEIQSVTRPKAQVSVEKVDEEEKQFAIKVTGYKMPVYADSLLVAIWAEKGNRNDLMWTSLNDDGNGNYSYICNVSDHKLSGTYQAHVYLKYKDESMHLQKAASFEVTDISFGSVSVQELDNDEGSCKVVVEGVSSPSGIKEVLVPIWSKNDQSDLNWYGATKQTDGTYTVEMNVANHKYNIGKYNIDVYVTDNRGIFESKARTDVEFTQSKAEIEAQFTDNSSSCKYSAKKVSVPGGIKGVLFASWSEIGGQDDLRWSGATYSSSEKSWNYTATLKDYKHNGKINVHAYSQSPNGDMMFLGSTTYEIPGPKCDEIVATANSDNGDIDVSINNVSAFGGVKNVQVAIWSAADQNDLQWYNAVKDGGSNYSLHTNISKHKYNISKYNIHVYVIDGNGFLNNIGVKEVTLSSSTGNITVEETSLASVYKVQINDVKMAGNPEILFAAWSEDGGQDDLMWYSSIKTGGTNNYYTNIKIQNHKTLGKYQVHVYAKTKAEKMVFLGKTENINVSGSASATFSIGNINNSDASFELQISVANSPSGVNNVQVPVWTAADQNDLMWYGATRKSDNTFIVKIKADNHKHNLGVYKIGAYVTMGNGVFVGAGSTEYNFMPTNYLYVTNDVGTGKRKVVLKNAVGASTVQFPVWSDTNGQDDLVWYGATPVNGMWEAIISSTNHKNAGLFQVHAYVNNAWVGKTTFQFPASEFAKNGWYYENGYKFYYINDVKQTDLDGILPRQSSYLARVNRTTCTVTMYARDGGNGFIIPVKVFACSVGLPGTETPSGTFYTLQKYRWWELMGPSYGQYCTRIVGGILFHSVAGSNTTSYNLSADEYNKLGSPASHGCVRLCVRDAKWIYDNCSLNMRVDIYDSANPGPFGKPATIKIPAGQNWDPTDPNL